MLLVYSFISMIGTKLEGDGFTISLWRNAASFLKLFEHSKNPTTILWSIEILELLTNKYSPKPVIASERSLKKEIRHLTRSFLDAASAIAAGEHSLLFNGTEKRIVFPLPPSVYVDFFADCTSKLEREEVVRKTHFDRALSVFKKEDAPIENNANDPVAAMLNWKSIKEEGELHSKYRLFALKTLRRVGVDIIQNIYLKGNDARIGVKVDCFVLFSFKLEAGEKLVHSVGSRTEGHGSWQ